MKVFDDTKLTWIPVKDISVLWVKAQRPFNEAWAKKIAERFDPQQFDPVRVTLPNGNGVYHAVEGQHRVRGVEMRFGSEEKVPCIVLNATDPERAAKLWLESNKNKKAALPIDAFLVAITAKEKIETEVNKVVTSCGFHVGHVNEHTKNAIQAVSALKTVYSRDGGPALTAALNQISATWGKGDNNAVAAPIINGYGAFFGEFPPSKVNLGRLKEVIQQRYAPGRLLGQARSKRDAATTKKPLPICVKEILIERYNYRLKSSEQLKTQ
jgi:hypothetical protein